MEYWVRDEDYKRFDTREDAYEDSLINEDRGYFAERLEGYFTLEELLYWAMQQDGFWEHFYDKIAEAEEECFINSYSRHNTLEDEEEA